MLTREKWIRVVRAWCRSGGGGCLHMQGEQWLTYKQAAVRVRASERTIRHWARRGMVMGWEVIDGQRTRVVREDVLLAWWRDTMDSNPVHQLRLRKRLEAAGIA